MGHYMLLIRSTAVKTNVFPCFLLLGENGVWKWFFNHNAASPCQELDLVILIVPFIANAQQLRAKSIDVLFPYKTLHQYGNMTSHAQQQHSRREQLKESSEYNRFWDVSTFFSVQ